MPFNPVDCGLRRLDHPTSIDEVLAAITADGAVVVSGLIDRVDSDRINDELSSYVDRREPGFRSIGGDQFYGLNTKRIQGLATRSRTFVDSVLVNPTLLAVADHFLLPNCGDYWMSQAETIFIGPGSEAQILHRDDLNWSRAATLGIDIQLSVLVALGDYDAAVGATMVVPRVNRSSPGPFDSSSARPVELEVGDALLYLGHVVHGGGANTTSDRWRKALYVGYLLGWLTPEESVPLSIPAHVARNLPRRARELLDWSNIRGNRRDSGLASDLQLWQLDGDDARGMGDAYVDRRNQ